MKLAFIGTHGVGKTTLCYDLAGVLKKRLPRVDLVKEVARSCPLPINRRTTLAAQSWILHTQIAMEIVAADQHDAVICDRSILDNYAYLLAASGPHPALEVLVGYWMTTYDYLFKVPLTGTPKADGVRELDLDFQREIDEIIDRLLQENRVSFFKLPRANRSRWMAYILKVLETSETAAPEGKRVEDRSRQIPLPIHGRD